MQWGVTGTSVTYVNSILSSCDCMGRVSPGRGPRMALLPKIYPRESMNIEGMKMLMANKRLLDSYEDAHARQQSNDPLLV